MIALFGGSFNPIHNGHLKAAKLVIKQCKCKQLWFIPCYRHAFKHAQLEAFEHRANMVKLAAKRDKRFKISLIEKELAERSKKVNTTIETVLALKRRYPNQKFFWVIGSNLIREVPRWYRFEELIKEIRFVVVPIRGIYDDAYWLKENNALVLKGSVERLSSTEIRKMIKHGIAPKKLLPKEVWHYIDENILYVNEFTKKVFSVTRGISKGKVSTYMDIAAAIGKPKAYRAVGNALNKNCFESVPCHRVVKSDGSLGGFSRGIKAKISLLKKEGIPIKNGKIMNFPKFRLSYKELISLKKKSKALGFSNQ